MHKIVIIWMKGKSFAEILSISKISWCQSLPSKGFIFRTMRLILDGDCVFMKTNCQKYFSHETSNDVLLSFLGGCHSSLKYTFKDVPQNNESW